MKKYETGINLIRKGDYKGAYKFFTTLYATTNDLVAKFYYVIIDYNYFKDKTINQYYKEFLSLEKLPLKYKRDIIYPLGFLAYMEGDYKNSKKFFLLCLKNNISSDQLYLFLVESILNNYIDTKELNESLYYLDNISEENNEKEFLKTKVLIELKEFELANRSIERLYLTNSDMDQTDYINLLYYVKKQSFEEQIPLIKILCKKEKYREQALNAYVEYLIYKGNYNKAIEISTTLFNEYKKPFYIYNKASILKMDNKLEDAINLLAENINIFTYPDYIYEIISEYLIENNEYARAIKYLDLIKNKSANNYQKIQYCNLKCQLYDKMFKSIEEAKTKFKPYKPEALLLYWFYRFIEPNIKKCLFWLNLSHKYDLLPLYVYYNALLDINPNTKLYNKYVPFIFKYDDLELVEANLAIIYYHGLYNVEINTKKALEHANKLIEINRDPDSLTIIGALTEDKNEAFNYFKEAYQSYINGNYSTAGVAFYANCLILGYGINQDINAAYQILKKIINDEPYKININCINLYSYINIINNTNIKQTYDFLLKNDLYSLSPSRFYMLNLLARRLKLNINYDKEFIDSIKKCSLREKEHFNNIINKQKEFYPYLINNDSVIIDII